MRQRTNTYRFDVEYLDVAGDGADIQVAAAATAVVEALIGALCSRRVSNPSLHPIL